MKHILTSKVLIGLLVLILALNLTACDETSTEQAVKSEDNVENKAVEEAEKEVLNYQQIHREQVKKLKYPNDYEPWNYPAQEIVGNERTFYADGHLVNMPNYIGEWEELLGVKFIEIPEFYGGGSENYTYNRVYVLDENYVEYTFKINTESYEPKDNLEEELEQLRKTETLGFEIHYAENWKHNLSLKDYISLLPDKNIFTDDLEAVNNELAELYGVEMEPLGSDGTGYHLFVDKFDKGFTVDWECTQDGKARHLDIEYTPMPHLAYYKFINNEIPGYYDETDEQGVYFNSLFLDGEDSEFSAILSDVTNDGIAELAVIAMYDRPIISYSSNSGRVELSSSGNRINYDITIHGVIKESCSVYRDDSWAFYYDDNAEFISTYYYVLGERDFQELAYIQECKTHGEYFINGKLATEEQVKECKAKYGAISISFNPHTKEEVLEMIKMDSDIIYAGIRQHKQNQKEGKYIIEPYDDSALEEITFDDSKRPLVQLLMDIVNGYVYLNGYHDADYCGETSAFTLMDLNGDGKQEVLTSLRSDNGVLDEPVVYIKKVEGTYVQMANINGYIPETGELISSEGSIDTGAAIYVIEGEALRKVKEIWMDEFHNAWKVENEVQTSLSEEEFYSEYLSYENRMQTIKGELLTMENIEKVLGIKVCGNGRIIRDVE